MTNQQIKALQSIAKGIIESCNIDSIGAPSSAIYAALMGHGASLNQFNSIMDTLVKHGFLTHDSECHTYHATDSGIAWSNKIGA
jgi:predicted transcriptional regulator